MEHMIAKGLDVGMEVPSLKPGEVNLGTSIMAVQFDGGVVIGADSRTTSGSYIVNRVTDKLTPLANRVYVCRSGSAADTQAVADYIRLYLSLHTLELGKEPLVGTAARIGQQICYQNKANLMAGLIVAGFDEQKGGQVYVIPLGGMMERMPFAIGGSGSTYIYGYCDAHYKDNMTMDECVSFVKNSLSLAMSRDGSSGGVVRLAVITKDGVERRFFPGDKLPTSDPQFAWQG